MKAYKYLMMCIMAASVAMYGCSSDDEPRDEQAHQRMELTQEQETISENEINVAFSFMEQLCEAQNGDNVLFSPISKDLCAGLMINIVAEQDRASILGVYGATAADAINTLNNTRMNYFSYNNSNSKVFFANSVWANSPKITNQGEFNAMTAVQKKYYDADIRIMDFGKDNILNAVNNWCSDKTRKLIPKFLKEAPDAFQQFLAINTMYFDCAWQDEFKEAGTKVLPFYDAQGENVLTEIPMMSTYSHLDGYVSDRISAVALKYASSNYSAVFVLPAKGLTVKDILPDVKEMLQSNSMYVENEDSPFYYDVKIPRFTCETATDITALMEANGINYQGKQALGFGAMNSIGTIQASYLKVNEKGTKMSSITSSEYPIAPGGPTINIELNRPFLMIVKDDNHGSILLMAAIQMPKE